MKVSVGVQRREKELGEKTEWKVVPQSGPRPRATQLAFVEIDCPYIREGDRHVNGFGGKYFVL